MPPKSSGRSYLPHKAIIIQNGDDFEVIEEDLISDQFIIDTIYQFNRRAVLVGYDEGDSKDKASYCIMLSEAIWTKSKW